MDLENKALNDISKAVMEDNITRLKSILALLKIYFGFTFFNGENQCFKIPLASNIDTAIKDIIIKTNGSNI